MPVDEREYMRPEDHYDPRPPMPARDRINWFKVSCWLFATLVLVAGGKLLTVVSFLWATLLVFLLVVAGTIVVIRWLLT